jgi:hypothetical protein
MLSNLLIVYTLIFIIKIVSRDKFFVTKLFSIDALRDIFYNSMKDNSKVLKLDFKITTYIHM